MNESDTDAGVFDDVSTPQEVLDLTKLNGSGYLFIEQPHAFENWELVHDPDPVNGDFVVKVHSHTTSVYRMHEVPLVSLLGEALATSTDWAFSTALVTIFEPGDLTDVDPTD